MAFVAVVPAVGGAIATGIGAIGGGLAAGLGAVGGLASSIPVVGGILGPAIGGLGGMVGSIGGGLAGGIGGLAAGNIGGAISSLGSGLLGAGSNLIGGLGGMYTGADKMVGGILPNIGSAGITPSWVNPAAPAGSVPMTDASGLPQMSLPGAGGGPPLGEVSGMPVGSGGGGGLKGVVDDLTKIGKLGQKLGFGKQEQGSSGGVTQTGVQTRQITAPPQGQTVIRSMGNGVGQAGPRQLGAAFQAGAAAAGGQGGRPSAYQDKISGRGQAKGYNQYAQGAQVASSGQTPEDILRAQQEAMAQQASLAHINSGRMTSMQ
jgi:hypothetical protein